MSAEPFRGCRVHPSQVRKGCGDQHKPIRCRGSGLGAEMLYMVSSNDDTCGGLFLTIYCGDGANKMPSRGWGGEVGLLIVLK